MEHLNVTLTVVVVVAIPQTRPIGSSQMMQPPRHLDPVLLKQAAAHKPYLDNYLAHNAPELQKDSVALGNISNFPLGETH